MPRDERTEDASSITGVLVIDDHPLYCDALANTMEGLFSTLHVSCANSLGEGLRLLTSGLSPDLIMLDLNLPDVAGLNGFVQIREKVPEVPVIVISATSTDAVITALLSSGAAGFIPKDLPREEFARALLAVWEGSVYLPPGYRRPGRSESDTPDMGDLLARIAALSPQQRRILNLICEGKANKQIAWELSLAEATVKAHVTASLRRLGVRNRTQAALLMKEAALVSGLR
jgi:DNA-binding NarL/FixJ family response regulator